MINLRSEKQQETTMLTSLVRYIQTFVKTSLSLTYETDPSQSIVRKHSHNIAN